jgi:hypothetical protein
MRDRQPDYYLLGTKLPHDDTVSYKGRYVLTDSDSKSAPVYEGEPPKGFVGYMYVQPSGNDVWIIINNTEPILYQKYLDNGFNAYTFKSANGSAVIFYDDYNLQLIDSGVMINGTRGPL